MLKKLPKFKIIFSFFSFLLFFFPIFFFFTPSFQPILHSLQKSSQTSSSDSLTNKKTRTKRQATPAPTKVEWNAHMTEIKPVLIILKEFNKSKIVFKIDSLGTEKEYSVTNLIKAQNINAQYTVMSSDAQTELKLLYANGIDNVKLTKAYKTELDDFLTLIKPYLQDFKTMYINKVSVVFRIYFKIHNLSANLNKKGSELTSDAKDEFIKLWAADFDDVKMASAFRKLVNRNFNFYKPFLQSFKEINKTVIRVDVGNLRTYQIGNLTAFLDKPWETNPLARKEMIVLWNEKNSFNDDFLSKAYRNLLKKIRGQFMTQIHNTLNILKVIKVTNADIDAQGVKQNYSWPELTKPENIGKEYDKLSVSAQKEFTKLLANNIAKEKLTTIYNKQLDSSLNTMKNVLQTFFDINVDTVTIDDKSYSISNLTANLDKKCSELIDPAKTEFIDLLADNITKEKLIVVYKDIWNNFLAPIKQTLQVLKAINTTKITIDLVEYSIGELITNLDMDSSKQTAEALQQFTSLYNLDNGNAVTIKTQLDTALVKIKDDFFTDIKSILIKLQRIKVTSVDLTDDQRTKKSYSWSKLSKPENTGKQYSELSSAAQSELTNLFVNGIDKQEFTKIFQAIMVKIRTFQKNWDVGKVSTYLLWLPIFNIKEVKLSQNEILPVAALANAIKDMLLAEKFDFTKLESKAREELFNLLNAQGKLRQEKTFQDDVWRQIKNHSKWKAVEDPPGQLVLKSIRVLLVKVQELGIEKVAYPFFSEDYDLGFLQDNSDWKTISFKNLLAGMTVKINGTNVDFYSSLFPNKVVFQVPMKKLDTVFSGITIANIIKNLESAITNSSKVKIKLEPSKKQSETSKTKLESKNQDLIIGLSVGGGVFALSSLGGFLYWFFKIKK